MTQKTSDDDVRNAMLAVCQNLCDLFPGCNTFVAVATPDGKFFDYVDSFGDSGTRADLFNRLLTCIREAEELARNAHAFRLQQASELIQRVYGTDSVDKETGSVEIKPEA
jgi:hypothetical protein